MSLQFEDLFDWEKENDVHYYSLLDHKMKEDWEYYEKEPAVIKVHKPKKKKDEIHNNTLPF